MHKCVSAATAGILLYRALLSPLYAQTSPLTLVDAVSRAQHRAPAMVAAEAAPGRLTRMLTWRHCYRCPTRPRTPWAQADTPTSSAANGWLLVLIPTELGGKREARRGVAEAERGVTKRGLSATRADVTQQVTIAFIAIAAAEQRLGVTRSGHALASQEACAAHERIAFGKASPIEEARAHVLLVNAEIKLAKAERALALALADLVRHTGAARQRPSLLVGLNPRLRSRRTKP